MEFRAFASGSAGNLYVAHDGVNPLMLECGLPIARIRKLLDFKLSAIRACLVSHYHGDHAQGVRGVMDAGVDVYASKETWRALDLPFTHHRMEYAHPLQQFDIGGWRVLPFDLRHDAEGALGYLVEDCGGDRLMFACDTAFVPYKFNGLTHIAIECNYSADEIRRSTVAPERVARVLRHHMGLERVLKFLEANDLSKVRQIWLLHLSADHGDGKAFQDAVRRATGKPTYIATRKGER